MPESQEILMQMLVQRMDEIARDQKNLAEALRQSEHSASESRRRVHERLDNHTELLLDMGPRLAGVERSVEAEAPT